MNNLNKHIFIIGFMGTGKTVVSKELGALMGLNVLDIDSLIIEVSGMSIPEIFEQKGEAYFRYLETQTLEQIAGFESSIVSCGGGLPLTEINRKAMRKEGKVILLTSSPENIYKRVNEDTQRPLLKDNMNVEYIKDLMEKRQPAYDEAADITVSTDSKNILQICDEIVLRLGQLEDTE